MNPDHEKLLQSLFIKSEDLTGKEHKLAVNRLAVNEEGVVGFITKVKKLNNTLVFVGFELGKISEWVSLSPLILNTKVGFRSTLEICHILEESRPESSSKNVEISVSPPMPINGFPGPWDPSTWNKIELSSDDKDSFQNFMQKFLFPDSKPQKPPFSENDFKIDNEDDEDEDI